MTHSDVEVHPLRLARDVEAERLSLEGGAVSEDGARIAVLLLHGGHVAFGEEQQSLDAQ